MSIHSLTNKELIDSVMLGLGTTETERVLAFRLEAVILSSEKEAERVETVYKKLTSILESEVEKLPF